MKIKNSIVHTQCIIICHLYMTHMETVKEMPHIMVLYVSTRRTLYHHNTETCYAHIKQT